MTQMLVGFTRSLSVLYLMNAAQKSAACGKQNVSEMMECWPL